MITHEDLQEIERVMDELEIDAAARQQGVEIAINLARLQEQRVFFAADGRCLPQIVAANHPMPADGAQGGLDRSQREPHKLTEVGSTPTPATNPNAGHAQAYPKGRWP